MLTSRVLLAVPRSDRRACIFETESAFSPNAPRAQGHRFFFSFSSLSLSCPVAASFLPLMSSCGDMTQHNIFNRHNRTSVSLDSLGSQTDDESANTSPASVHATDSPIATFSPSAIPPDKVPKQEDRNVSPSALLDDSKQALKPEKEKRKRSRVTPEQLVHLERFFLIDRSPTATRRRDISELLGMQERQTQIWFQNRCAFYHLPRHRWLTSAS